jgi:hypothetical protein
LLLQLRVRGPLVEGGYDLFLDDTKICSGVSADMAARYIRDARLYGGGVSAEYLDGLDNPAPTMPPEIMSALATLDAVGDTAEEPSAHD